MPTPPFLKQQGVDAFYLGILFGLRNYQNFKLY